MIHRSIIGLVMIYTSSHGEYFFLYDNISAVLLTVLACACLLRISVHSSFNASGFNSSRHYTRDSIGNYPYPLMPLILSLTLQCSLAVIRALVLAKFVFYLFHLLSSIFD